LVSAGNDHVVKLWKNDAGQWKETQIFRGHTDWVTSLAFSRSGYFIVSAGADKTIKVWELASRELPLTSEHTGAVECVAVSLDGKGMAAWIPFDERGTRVSTFDPVTGNEWVQLNERGKEFLAVAWTREIKLVAFGAKDGSVRVHKIGDDRLDEKPAEFALFDKVAVTSLGFTPDGDSLVVGSEKGKLLIVDPTN